MAQNNLLKPLDTTRLSHMRTNLDGIKAVSLYDQTKGAHRLLNMGIGVVDRMAALISPKGTHLANLRLELMGIEAEKRGEIIANAFYLNQQEEIESYGARADALHYYAQKLQSAGYQIETKSFSQNDTDLYTDAIYIKRNSDTPPSKLAVVSTGTHGIEGFRGNDNLIYIMQQLLAQAHTGKSDFIDLNETSLVLVNSLNPEGMKNQRRVNNDGNDMNRTLDRDPEIKTITDNDKAMVDRACNPDTPIGEDETFLGIIKGLKAAIKRIGSTKVKGVMISGHRREREKDPAAELIFRAQEEVPAHFKAYFKYLKEIAKRDNTEEILVLDWHTGYGKIKENLVADEGFVNEATAKALFPNRPLIELKEGEGFYKAHGTITKNMKASFEDEEVRVTPLFIEDGTLSSASDDKAQLMAEAPLWKRPFLALSEIWGPIGNACGFYAMARENQYKNFGATDDKLGQKLTQRTRKFFNMMFYPNGGLKGKGLLLSGLGLLWGARMNHDRNHLLASTFRNWANFEGPTEEGE